MFFLIGHRVVKFLRGSPSNMFDTWLKDYLYLLYVIQKSSVVQVFMVAKPDEMQSRFFLMYF